MQDQLIGPLSSLTTAITGSTTSTARAYFNSGGPIKGIYGNFLFGAINTVTVGTLGMTFTPRILCSADGTAYRVLTQGAPITAVTTTQTNKPVALFFTPPAAEPYIKAEVFGATATNAVTPYATFYMWLDTASASPVQQ
jgi:hypothetical protein